VPMKIIAVEHFRNIVHRRVEVGIVSLFW
jgi:hypothetical protein